MTAAAAKVDWLARAAIGPLGIGVSQFGNLYRETSDETSSAAVAQALSEGVRYFDTAPHYGLGLSERRLGAALVGTPRDSVVISTKVGRLLVDSPETADRLDPEGFVVPAALRREWNFSRDGILRSVEASLQRLRTDRIDIAYLHDPDDFWESASTSGVDALVELREQGVIGAVGAGMNQAAMLADFIERTDVDIVMVAGRLTLLNTEALDRLLPAAITHGVAVVAAGVYNSGLLSSSEVRPDAHFDYRTPSTALIDRAQRISDVCRTYDVELPVAAVQYPLRHPAVCSVVLGSRTPEHVRSNVQRARTAVPDDLWLELDELGLAPDPIGILR